MQSPSSLVGSRPQDGGSSAGRLAVAFLGSYPPRPSAIATFTKEIYTHYPEIFPGSQCLALAMTDDKQSYEYPRSICLEIQHSCEDDYRQAARFLNGVKPSVVSLQHDYDIFGGCDGKLLIDFLNTCEIPVVTTMHSVIPNPTPRQWQVTENIISGSCGIVVMTQKARDLLLEHYTIDGDEIHVIPHGAPTSAFPTTDPSKRQLGLEKRAVLLTHGVLGPDMGLEIGIRAMRAVADRHPEALYIILGVTHPAILESKGERYRQRLHDLVTDLDLSEHVHFVDTHANEEKIALYLGATDIYLAPYPGESHVVSGTLAVATGYGCPVIATPFWHACEIITEARGILTPSNDVPRLSGNINALLGDPERRQAMRGATLRSVELSHWPEVVRQYERVFTLAGNQERSRPLVPMRNYGEEISPHADSFLQWFDHLLLMTDATGIWHRARYQVPDQRHGYRLSDNAAALLLTGHLRAAGKDAKLPWNEFSNPYFAFVLRAYNAKEGRFRNHLSAEERWLEEVGSEESQAQALWALGTLSELNTFTYLRAPIRAIFQIAYPEAGSFFNLRSRAYALLGLNGYLTAEPSDTRARALHCEIKNCMAQQFTQNGGPGWPWPEDALTSASAKLPHALLAAAHTCDDELSMGLALNSLEWLMEIQTAPSGSFRPAGNRGRHARTSRGGPAQFDQLPVDAHASVSACIAAWRITGQDSWFHLAENTFQWFLGANDLGLSLYDPNNGGCCDALQEQTVNENQSAQSLLAYHLSLVELKTARREFFASRGSVSSPVRRTQALVAASV